MTMLSPTILSRVLECAQTQGADFAEIFVEHSHTRSTALLDGRVERCGSGESYGVGVRLIYGGEVYYGYSCDSREEPLLALTRSLGQARAQGAPGGRAPLERREVVDRHAPRSPSGTAQREERIALLRQLNEGVRTHGAEIVQVGVGTLERCRRVLIANSEGLWTEDERHYVRLMLSAVADRGDGPHTAQESPGALGGSEFFQGLNAEALCAEVAQSALRSAGAGYIDGGLMPVVLGNGFGGVIFHEACGHPLETEAVRRGGSPFTGKLGEPVAQEVLSAVDDGTLDHEWGSCNLDDEGMPTERTLLIENGILRRYLSDRIGAAQLNVPRTGSARRESYRFAPVSRMRNTFIERGTSTQEEMLASIPYGLYARKMGGGSVDPATGEFNFSVQEGYIIRNGRITEPVRGATLIGRGHEILPRISMIGSDLSLAAGMCGASSGWVPTTVGQPTLKVDRILVGGR